MRRYVLGDEQSEYEFIYNNKKEPVRPVQMSCGFWKKNVIVHIIPLRILSIALVFR